MQDNAGFNTSPSPGQSQPIIGTGAAAQALTNASADTNTEATVVAGARYRFTAAEVGGFVFGLATTAAVGNVRWACPIYQTIEIQIPLGYTTLHYAVDTNDGYGRLVRIKTEIEEEPSL